MLRLVFDPLTKAMPEENNRILTDHVSNLLFCPTETAVISLGNKGINEGVHNVGDVMWMHCSIT